MAEKLKETDKTILRFVTVGSVDDGKSTLIGRLLYETNCIYDDQYSAIEEASKRRGYDVVDLSLLLDGLSAEREQGITIDVAYRYFTSDKRKYIVTDTPGHEQYTRNMVTGASNAELAIILIDARNGILTQSKRHGFLVSLLQIPHLVVVINKMDLVDYSQNVYDEIVREYEIFSEKLDIHDITYIPGSALMGDNMVTPSTNMPWYSGNTLFYILEHIHVTADRNLIDFRFPVQYVIRPDHTFRGYAGKIASGTIQKGEDVTVLPSGKTSKIKSIVTYDGELDESFVGQSIVLTLDDEIDISRGDMIVRKNNIPNINNSFDAIICWMDEEVLNISKLYILKQGTKKVKAFINKIFYKIDINTLHRQNVNKFELNDIGRVKIQTSQPIFFDSYKDNHVTGSFILIDLVSNHTVATGMIKGVNRSIDNVLADIKSGEVKSKNIQKHELVVSRKDWELRNGHEAAVLWLTGLSASGKSTIAEGLAKELYNVGCHVMLLDGDNVRHGLCSDLGFSFEDRSINIHRVGEVAKLFFNQGNIIICSFISPFAEDRDFVRALIPKGRFIETFIKCDINICKERDPKGLYKKVESGLIQEFTGISSPYEEPESPEIVINTEKLSINESISELKTYLLSQNILNN